MKQKIIDGNKLIAEFMGFEYNMTDSFDNDNYRLPDVYRERFLRSHFDNLHFNTSWDWLMPVLHKCFAYDNLRMKQEINLAMFGYNNIEALWLAVVEFITWYNKQKE